MPEEQGENRDGRFKPGESGNPGGRPKGSLSLGAILRRKLSAGDGAEAEAVADALILAAKGGDVRAIQQIFDRIDGKVPDRHEHTGAEGGAILVEHFARALNRVYGDPTGTGRSISDGGN